MRLRTAALAVTASIAAPASAGTVGRAIKVQRRPCSRTFTSRMFLRAARTVYAGTGLPHRGAYGHLWREAHCARAPFTERQARIVWHRQLVAWVARRQAASNASMSTATASWYDDSSGQTASGFHAYYGFASLILSFGTRVRFCYRGRCVLATDDDHGPYISGRTFDLNQNTAGALGFSGVDTVAYRVGG